MQHLPFASFNPRLYGISQISDDAQLKLWESYLNATDLAEWLRMQESKSIKDLGPISALDHEIRHFHDFLISPFGSAIMGLRMQASSAGIHALKAIMACDGQFVPVPLTRWMSWDHSARHNWIESTGKHFGVKSLEHFIELPESGSVILAKPGYIQEVDVKAPPQEQLAVYTEVSARAFDLIKNLRRRTDFGLGLIAVAAGDIFEATAHVIQSQSIWNGQDKEAAGHYMQTLMTANSDYLNAFQVLITAINQHSMPSAERLMALFTWMLLGAEKQLLDIGHPGFRYLLVLRNGDQIKQETSPLESTSSFRLYLILVPN